jgi:hypothetical protein
MDRSLTNEKGLMKDSIVENIKLNRNKRQFMPGVTPPNDYFGKNWNFKKVKKYPY